MLLSVGLSVIECKCMCVSISKRVYKSVYMSVRVFLILMDFVLKLRKYVKIVKISFVLIKLVYRKHIFK